MLFQVRLDNKSNKEQIVNLFNGEENPNIEISTFGRMRYEDYINMINKSYYNLSVIRVQTTVDAQVPQELVLLNDDEEDLIMNKYNGSNRIVDFCYDCTLKKGSILKYKLLPNSYAILTFFKKL